MLFEDLDKLVEEAYRADSPVEVDATADLTEEELVAKFAEAVENYEPTGNSRLGLAKILTAVDILGS